MSLCYAALLFVANCFKGSVCFATMVFVANCFKPFLCVSQRAFFIRYSHLFILHSLSLSVSARYAAPEVLEEKAYGYPIDVWAAGICLYVMLDQPPCVFIACNLAASSCNDSFL